MIPGMNPRKMGQMMKKMGISQVEIPAKEVIIKAEGKDIIIKNPQVAKVNVMGQDTFQITGQIEEREAQVPITEDDIKTIVEQTQVSEAKAREVLEKNKGDLAASILELQD